MRGTSAANSHHLRMSTSHTVEATTATPLTRSTVMCSQHCWTQVLDSSASWTSHGWTTAKFTSFVGSLEEQGWAGCKCAWKLFVASSIMLAAGPYQLVLPGLSAYSSGTTTCRAVVKK